MLCSDDLLISSGELATLMSKEIWFSAISAVNAITLFIFGGGGQKRSVALSPEHIHKKLKNVHSLEGYPI